MIPRSFSHKRTLGVFAALLVLMISIGARAWDAEALFDATVHEHEFSLVWLRTTECTAQVQVFFLAPKKQYESGTKQRNYYRFRARVNLDKEREVLTKVFGNPKPGSRVYTERVDTSAEGCWAKEEHKLRGVDVEGCRGRGCKVEPFK